jgi:hypothetical protein
MLGAKKLWAMLLCFGLLVFLTVPAMAADPEVTKKDLKGISPQHHKYLFSVIGGAAIGAGIGFLVGSGTNVGKGIMVGGGGASALYLHSHRHDDLNGWRNWAYVASYSSFGGGMGWTLCGCNTGLVSGMLIGGGATGVWLADHPQRVPQTAGNPNNP